MSGRRWAAIALVCGDVAALVVLRPHPSGLARHCAHLGEWFATAGADRAVAALAEAGLWCAAAWLAVGLLAACGSRLPGFAGRFAAASCRVFLPAALRRLLAGSIGLSVLFAPALAGAHPVPHPRSPVGTRLDAPVIPAIEHPHLAPAAPPVGQAPHHAPAGKTVRVRPGDSLWLLAATRLGPRASDAEIAAYWPRWYAANRAVIGDDPSVITPGEVLHIPAPAH